MKWILLPIPCILFIFIPVSTSPEFLEKCNSLMTTSSKDFFYSYELDHEGCTLRCTILFPSNPQKYKDYLDSSKIKNYFFNNISCGSGRVCLSGACKTDPKLQPFTTPKPFEQTKYGRVIVLIKSAHFSASESCGRVQQPCDVRVQFQIGSKKWDTKVVRSDRPEWNEEINVDFDVESNDSIHFSVWSGYPKAWNSKKRLGNFSVNLQDLTEKRKSGKPIIYEFGKSTSFVVIAITWNNKYERGYL